MRVVLLPLFCMLVAAGCTARLPHAATQPATQAATVAAPPTPVEVQYDPSLTPDALSAARKAELIRASLVHVKGVWRAWFVCVRYNKNGIFTADLYYAPDVTSPRIRRGTFARTESWGDLLSLVKEGPSKEMARYVQVSKPDAPFDDWLSVPYGDMIPFDPERRFFGDAVKLSDAELVELVDLVRPVFEKNGGEPIYRIEKKGDGIRVFSGVNQGPLAGGGRYVDVKWKVGGGFELEGDEVGIWMN